MTDISSPKLLYVKAGVARAVHLVLCPSVLFRFLRDRALRRRRLPVRRARRFLPLVVAAVSQTEFGDGIERRNSLEF